MARRSGQPETVGEAFDTLRADWQMAHPSPYRRDRKGLAPMGSSANYHFRSEGAYYRMMELARDMERNDAAVGPLLKRATDNTLHGGFTLQPNTGDAALDNELYDRWEAWAGDPEQVDLQGEDDWHSTAWRAFYSELLDGDCALLPLASGQLEFVEGHRIRTPSNTKRNVVLGVLCDENLRRQEFWVTKEDVGPLGRIERVSDVRQIPVRDADGERQVFQIYDSTRKSQVRGVTALAPLVDLLGMHEDLQFAKLVQAQVTSLIAFVVERDANFTPGSASLSFGAKNADGLAVNDGATAWERFKAGLVVRGAKGETINPFSANVPNAEFFPHMEMVLTLISVNLGVPLMMLLLDGSKTNFSGWRGALDQAKFGFERNQRILRARLYRPVYRWKIRQWMAEDAALRNAAARLEQSVSSPADIFTHTWALPKWPYIQPLQDAQADLLRKRNALSSPRRVHGERGEEWEVIAQEIVQDNVFAIRLAKQAAKQLNAEFNDEPVSWREIISLPTPDGVQIGLQPAGQQEQQSSRNGAQNDE